MSRRRKGGKRAVGNSEEYQRLAALDRFEVLDTPPEPLFDSLTDLAARTFDVPICLISLVDQERQWFKSCVGLDVASTPRSISFCQHAISSDEVFVVLDAQRDDRFRNNPLVTGPPDIRFYAGAPLITPQGHRLGTLCIIDRAPRTAFTDAERDRLRAIGQSVVQALVLRLHSRERERVAALAEERQTLLELAEQMAGIGTWSWDLATNRTIWSDEVYKIHGLEPESLAPDVEGVLASYHPEDAQALAHCIKRAVSEGADYKLEARIIRPDRSTRYVMARGACRCAADGSVTGLFGTLQDVTEYVQAAKFTRTVTDNLPGLAAYWDKDLRCRFANARY